MLVHIQEASRKTRYSVNTIKKYVQDCKIYGEGNLVDLNQLIERRKLTQKARKVSYSNQTRNEVVRLFLSTNDNSNKSIGKKVGLSEQVVNNILNKYLNEKQPR